MKVRLIRERTIEKFVTDHANSKRHFDNWLYKLKSADWIEPVSIIQTYNANLIGADRVIFDIGGNGRNAFRIICTYQFGVKYVILYINWVGTHEEYNALNNQEKLTIWKY